MTIKILNTDSVYEYIDLESTKLSRRGTTKKKTLITPHFILGIYQNILERKKDSTEKQVNMTRCVRRMYTPEQLTLWRNAYIVCQIKKMHEKIQMEKYVTC